MGFPYFFKDYFGKFQGGLMKREDALACVNQTAGNYSQQVYIHVEVQLGIVSSFNIGSVFGT